MGGEPSGHGAIVLRLALLAGGVACSSRELVCTCKIEGTCVGAGGNVALGPHEGGASGAGLSSAGGAGGATSSEPVLGTILYDFADNLDGFEFNEYEPSDPSQTNLSGSSEFEWVAGEGSPEAGAARVVVPFTDFDQFAEIAHEFPGRPLDLEGTTLFAQVKTDGSVGGVVLCVKTGSQWVYGDRWSDLVPGGDWHEYELELATAQTYDPPEPLDVTQVVTIGLVFHTGSSGTGNPTETTYTVDTIGYRDTSE